METGFGAAGLTGVEVTGLGGVRALAPRAGGFGVEVTGFGGVSPPTAMRGAVGVDVTGRGAATERGAGLEADGLDVTGLGAVRPPTLARGVLGVEVTGFGGLVLERTEGAKEAAALGCAAPLREGVDADVRPMDWGRWSGIADFRAGSPKDFAIAGVVREGPIVVRAPDGEGAAEPADGARLGSAWARLVTLEPGAEAAERRRPPR